MGCEVKDIYFPEINETAIAAMLGMVYAVHKARLDREKNGQKCEFKNDVNLKFLESLGSTVSDLDQTLINKQRTRSMKIIENIFNEVDVFLLPTTSRFPEHHHPSHDYRGYINTWTISHQTLFSALSSLTGIPSLAITIGKDESNNLPISVQLMSKWWSEDMLLSVAYQIERLFPLTSTPPDFQHIIQQKDTSS